MKKCWSKVFTAARIKTLLSCALMLAVSPIMADYAVKGISYAAAGDFLSVFMPQNEHDEKLLKLKLDAGFDERLANSNGFGLEEELPNAGKTIITSPDTMVNVGLMPYPTEFTQNDGMIYQNNYGAQKGTAFINLDRAGQVRNKTSVPNEVLIEESRKLPDFKIDFGSKEPQVLIMHTHTTESFEPYERDFYGKNFSYRTTDETKNVVAAGAAMARQLEEAGIKTIHDTTQHDYPEFNGCYKRSAKTVEDYLALYPSIKIVLDVHRDAIADGNNLPQPVTSVNGEKAAQIMIISGCDDGTMGMPNYLKNFRLAALMQNQMESDYSGFTRPVLFDYRSYNQKLTTGSLLIEIGSHGNTVAQAVYAGELAGKSLAKALFLLKA